MRKTQVVPLGTIAALVVGAIVFALYRLRLARARGWPAALQPWLVLLIRQGRGLSRRQGAMRQSVELAQRSRTPTARILQSLSPKDFDTATNSATALSRTCKTCHNFYKKS
jgi:hypothetical protein